MVDIKVQEKNECLGVKILDEKVRWLI